MKFPDHETYYFGMYNWDTKRVTTIYKLVISNDSVKEEVIWPHDRKGVATYDNLPDWANRFIVVDADIEIHDCIYTNEELFLAIL